MSQAPPLSALRGPDLTATLDRALGALRRQQRADGSWQGELESNASITAEYCLLRRFLGDADPAREAAAVRWLRRQQGPDGGFPIAPGLPGDVSVTVEVWVALRAVGVPDDDPALRRAHAFAAAGGGVPATRVFTRMWLALGGLWEWEAIPVIPPEWMLWPAPRYGSIYDFASWARATLVPLTILRTLGTVFALDHPRRPELPWGPPRPPHGGHLWRGLDRALRLYGRAPAKGLRERGLAAAERWILAHQEADGSWAGIQPPWVYGIMGLVARGYPLDHPVVARGLRALESFGVEDQDGWRLQACISPVWDTALALWGLCEAGAGADDEAVRTAVAWLQAREIRARGDWAVRRPAAEPGGWAFELHNDWYPDIDDTAVVVCALAAGGWSADDGSPIGAAIGRGLDWLQAMQGRDGGFAAFDADNTRGWVRRPPVCDFGEVLDPPSPDVTAHVLEGFVRAGDARHTAAAARAAAWLRRSEEADGAYHGRWGVNYVYGTGAAITAYAARRDPQDRRHLERATGWLVRHQQADGGFGESVRSYEDPRWRGHGPPTASQTAWALFGLAHDPRHQVAADRAVAWLAERQRTDGGWDEPEFTGTGFPGDFYLNYHLYRLTWPVLALARLGRGPRRDRQPGRARP